VGQEDDDAEVVARRLAQLVLEDPDDLRRPQELVLEVDQVLGLAQRADVALEDRELAAREHPVGALRHRAGELHRRVAGGRKALGDLQRLPGGRLPAQGEVRGDVAHDRPAQQR